jgi:hypothetical protein
MKPMRITVTRTRTGVAAIATTLAFLAISSAPATGQASSPTGSGDSVVVASSTRLEPGDVGGRYTVTVTNEGSDPVEGLTVRYPTDDTILEAIADTGAPGEDGWEINLLPGGGLATLELVTAR